MNFMMNPKTVLTVIAVLNALHGILWIFFLPLPEMGEEAVLIGTTYGKIVGCLNLVCLLYTSPSPRDGLLSRMPSSA